MMVRGERIGIVGHEAAKFAPATEEAARDIIRFLLQDPYSVLISGACPLGGIDIWAEEEADALGREKVIFAPRNWKWDGPGGFKERNLAIAASSDIVHCIVVSTYPESYTSMRFNRCYHCHTTTHIKSGGCWTAKHCARHEWWIL